MAQELMKASSAQQAGTPGGGLAKALSMMTNAYSQKQLQNEYGDRGREYADALAAIGNDPKVQQGVPALVDPSTGAELVPPVSPGIDTMVAMLGSGKYADNPDLQEYATQLRGDKIKRESDLLDKVKEAELLMPYKLKVAAAGATRVNVGAQEKEEDKAVGKAFGEDYVALQKSGREAPGKIAKYDRLDQLLDGIDTGTFKGTTTELKAAAKGAGINLEELGIKDDVAPIQAAKALTNAMALELRNPSGGAGMPGALSDADRQYLTSMVPGIEKTPEGRKLMSDTARALARREAEVAQLARNYRSKNGKLDEGFYDVLAQFSEANPLFKDVPNAPTPKVPSARPPLDKFMRPTLP
jgi:hypothetical protein